VDKKISKVAREKCSYLDFKKKKSFMKVNNNFKIRVIKYLGFNALYSHTRIHDDLPRASQRSTKSPHFYLLGSMQKEVGCESFLPQDNNGAKSHRAHFPKEKDHVHDKARRKRFSITLA
jgi:hypothetical protein